MGRMFRLDILRFLYAFWIDVLRSSTGLAVHCVFSNNARGLAHPLQWPMKTGHSGQEFNARGLVACLSMIVPLTRIALAPPGHTSIEGEFSATQVVAGKISRQPMMAFTLTVFLLHDLILKGFLKLGGGPHELSNATCC